MDFTTFISQPIIKLFESTLFETVAEMPPSWHSSFTKDENADVNIKVTSNINNKTAFSTAINNGLNDKKTNGILVLIKDIPLFAIVKAKKISILSITVKQAQSIKHNGWQSYVKADSLYFKAISKHNGDIEKANVVKAVYELASGFVSNFVKGNNDELTETILFRDYDIVVKTLAVEGEAEETRGGRPSTETEHENKAIQLFSTKYLEKLIKDAHKLIDKELPDILKAEKMAEDSIDGSLTKINIEKVTDMLKKINTIIDKFGAEYNNKKAANSRAAANDPDWEEKMVNDYISGL